MATSPILLSPYFTTCACALLQACAPAVLKPHHLEGWMRAEWGCLDGLSFDQFVHEAAMLAALYPAAECTALLPVLDALATSFGLGNGKEGGRGNSL